jgi:subtilase family serine protease
VRNNNYAHPLVVAISDAGALAATSSSFRVAVTRTGEAKPVGNLPSDQIMSLDIVLKLRNQVGLDSFLKKPYDPSSPSKRHFLTLPEFTERFGTTQAEYDAVVHLAQVNGFEVVGGTRDGMDVQIKGPVSAVETASI